MSSTVYLDAEKEAALSPSPSPSSSSEFELRTSLASENEDLEAFKPSDALWKDPPPSPLEYSVPLRTKFLALGLYFILNLSLTIHSKVLLGRFAFPYLLTTIHTGVTALGCYVLMLRGHITLTRQSTKDNLILVAFSTLFTINIAISNVSLSLVSVAFHQIVRSTVPIFTCIIYRLYLHRSYSVQTYLTFIPITLGVFLVTYGDYYFTLLGFSLTVLGTVLAAVKTVTSNRLMTGNLALPALEILLRMTPLAALQSLLYAHLTGEIPKFYELVVAGQFSRTQAFVIFCNAFIAFLLNVSSFHTNKVAGALTISVCANVKQVATVLLGILVFDVRVGMLNGAGMVITLIGAAWYSKVELNKKRAPAPQI
ncbi:hypothetical protein BP5796_02928 [Coleophoma crateriformis]|uniref:Sugar phosphate transporter domain-containing protein n=1 Tax=Coleophoma crateriformis TaxID=565419 RepID=A0A3D8SM23_9HELO|nr:hypothetical protein BP5796_02928 [Coleophoma crateriformis]